MSNRARRRAYRQMLAARRDGGTFAPVNPGAAPVEPSAFREMKPARVLATKTSACHRERVVLQEIFAGRPKGKRRIRYTTTVRWDGGRCGGPDTGQTDTSVPRGVRILPPK